MNTWGLVILAVVILGAVLVPTVRAWLKPPAEPAWRKPDPKRPVVVFPPPAATMLCKANGLKYVTSDPKTVAGWFQTMQSGDVISPLYSHADFVKLANELAALRDDYSSVYWRLHMQRDHNKRLADRLRRLEGEA